MCTISPRQRVTLARRIAAGLPVWAAARGSNLPAEDVGDLMGEPEFRDLIGAWSEIFDLSPEARSERLLRLAHMVIERRLTLDCGRTAHFILREAHRRRDPVARLAKGFSQLVEMEKHRVERHGADPAEPTPAPLAAELSPVAEAEAAERILENLAAATPEQLLRLLDRVEAESSRAGPAPARSNKAPQGP